MNIVPGVIHRNDPDLDAEDTTDDNRDFSGFSKQDIPTLELMATLLRRNQALNLCEGILSAAVVVSTYSHTNSFEVSERVLYIVCCLSNAVCLRCATSGAAWAEGLSACAARTLRCIVHVSSGIVCVGQSIECSTQRHGLSLDWNTCSYC